MPKGMQCPRCGTPRAADDLYCGHCGSPLPPLRRSAVPLLAAVVGVALLVAGGGLWLAVSRSRPDTGLTAAGPGAAGPAPAGPANQAAPAPSVPAQAAGAGTIIFTTRAPFGVTFQEVEAGTQRPLSSTTFPVRSTAGYTVTERSGFDLTPDGNKDPRFSPDSSLVATAEAEALVVRSADGKESRYKYANASPVAAPGLVPMPSVWDRTLPAWSADGRYVAVVGNSSLFVVDAARGLMRGFACKPVKLVPRSLNWLPKGDLIISGEGSLVEFSPADGNCRKLPTKVTSIHDLSPDGTRVLWLSKDPAGKLQVWSGGLNGTDSRQLTRGDQDHQWPHFSPDGSQVAFITGTLPGLLQIMQADGSGVATPVRQDGRPMQVVSSITQWLPSFNGKAWSAANGQGR